MPKTSVPNRFFWSVLFYVRLFPVAINFKSDTLNRNDYHLRALYSKGFFDFLMTRPESKMLPNPQSFRIRIQNWICRHIEAVLGHTHDHYFSFFPKNPGFFIQAILRMFYSGIRMDPHQASAISTLPKNAVIVYVCKYRRRFEYLFYHNRLAKMGLPCPEIAFDSRTIFFQPVSRIFKVLLAHIDHLVRNRSLPDPFKSEYFERSLLSGHAGYVTLLETDGFLLRFLKSTKDPFRQIIELKKKTDRPVFMVPQLMFFSRTPHRNVRTLVDIFFGTEENPGRLRRMVTLFKNPGKVFVEVPDPIDLKTFLSQPEVVSENTEVQSFLLRRQLIEQINRHRQSITGPIIKSREEIKQDILTGDRLNDFLIHHARTREIPLPSVRKEASDCIDEIAANYNPSFVRFGALLIKWLLESMFEGVSIDPNALYRVKQLSKKGPIIFVPCHKSHIDYLVLPYILYSHNMPAPHIVAGNNLSFWPLGPLFRMGGAFFIRRTFRGAVLYSRVFSEYVYKLLEEGFNIKVFIEGGRSRTGKLLMPKLGFLSILLNAFKNGACDELIFIPIFIGYDRVLEEGSYLSEIEGGQKESESLIQVIKARKFLKKRYGRIYIKLGDAFSTRSLFNEASPDGAKLSQKDFNGVVRNLGYHLASAIDGVSVVTPHALAASAILNAPKPTFTLRQLRDNIETYLTYLNFQQATLADSLLLDTQTAIDNALGNYLQRKFIETVSLKKGTGDAEVIYQLRENQRSNLEYYKNNAVAFFLPASFTALAILEKDAFQFSAPDLHAVYAFLQEFFKFEFAFNTDRPPEYLVRKNLKAFIDDAILMPHPMLPDTYNLTSSGFRKLKCFTSFLKTFFEAYAVVLDFFEKSPKNGLSPKDRLRKIQARGNRMYKLKQIERKESLSKIYYQNAVDFFLSQGIKGLEDEEKITFYSDMIKRYRAYL
ncbi:MAG: glycerol-3-phosphate acyltransferase [Desulfobacterales bacterium CG07_land_8_20_14_0_80_52_14]|nr:MAG: glycerol-3-phosphate acyltransferase [Desulfobacterales bacterium CG23_combo_of_CG06-09_8_20_14_all_52_9]PIU49423.1 MAG: glycerol-3-phosphate acyltransferase [Desulfobacterales bacterium CG07_land_8_20_14_0_80_52_14]